MKKKSRRNFLLAGVSLAAVVGFFRPKEVARAKEPLKFLTKDGRLVYVDANKVPVVKRTASKNDLRTWINDKQHGSSSKD